LLTWKARRRSVGASGLRLRRLSLYEGGREALTPTLSRHRERGSGGGRRCDSFSGFVTM
jgi:hypothetical protein